MNLKELSCRNNIRFDPNPAKKNEIRLVEEKLLDKVASIYWLIFRSILVKLKTSTVKPISTNAQPAFETMNYEHPNSENGDSMSHPGAGDSRPSKNRKTGKPSADHSTSSASSSSISNSERHQCSYCGETFIRSETKHMPFCSQRCQQIDLGMWLNESYGFPCESDSSTENHGTPVDDDDA